MSDASSHEELPVSSESGDFLLPVVAAEDDVKKIATQGKDKGKGKGKGKSKVATADAEETASGSDDSEAAVKESNLVSLDIDGCLAGAGFDQLTHCLRETSELIVEAAQVIIKGLNASRETRVDEGIEKIVNTSIAPAALSILTLEQLESTKEALRESLKESETTKLKKEDVEYAHSYLRERLKSFVEAAFEKRVQARKLDDVKDSILKIVNHRIIMQAFSRKIAVITETTFAQIDQPHKIQNVKKELDAVIVLVQAYSRHQAFSQAQEKLTETESQLQKWLEDQDFKHLGTDYEAIRSAVTTDFAQELANKDKQQTQAYNHYFSDEKTIYEKVGALEKAIYYATPADLLSARNAFKTYIDESDFTPDKKASILSLEEKLKAAPSSFVVLRQAMLAMAQRERLGQLTPEKSYELNQVRERLFELNDLIYHCKNMNKVALEHNNLKAKLNALGVEDIGNLSGLDTLFQEFAIQAVKAFHGLLVDRVGRVDAVAIGSNRQGILTNIRQFEKDMNVDGFWLLQLYSKTNKVKLDSLLLMDVVLRQTAGTEFSRYCDGGTGIAELPDDPMKIMLTLMQMHYFANMVSGKYRHDYVDDRRDILAALYFIYSQHPHMIPKNTVLHLHLSDGTEFTKSYKPLQGTGPMFRYRNIREKMSEFHAAHVELEQQFKKIDKQMESIQGTVAQCRGRPELVTIFDPYFIRRNAYLNDMLTLVKDLDHYLLENIDEDETLIYRYASFLLYLTDHISNMQDGSYAKMYLTDKKQAEFLLGLLDKLHSLPTVDEYFSLRASDVLFDLMTISENEQAGKPKHSTIVDNATGKTTVIPRPKTLLELLTAEELAALQRIGPSNQQARITEALLKTIRGDTVVDKKARLTVMRESYEAELAEKAGSPSSSSSAACASSSSSSSFSSAAEHVTQAQRELFERLKACETFAAKCDTFGTHITTAVVKKHRDEPYTILRDYFQSLTSAEVRERCIELLKKADQRMQEALESLINITKGGKESSQAFSKATRRIAASVKDLQTAKAISRRGVADVSNAIEKVIRIQRLLQKCGKTRTITGRERTQAETLASEVITHISAACIEESNTQPLIDLAQLALAGEAPYSTDLSLLERQEIAHYLYSLNVVLADSSKEGKVNAAAKALFKFYQQYSYHHISGVPIDRRTGGSDRHVLVPGTDFTALKAWKCLKSYVLAEQLLPEAHSLNNKFAALYTLRQECLIKQLMALLDKSIAKRSSVFRWKDEAKDSLLRVKASLPTPYKKITLETTLAAIDEMYKNEAKREKRGKQLEAQLQLFKWFLNPTPRLSKAFLDSIPKNEFIPFPITELKNLNKHALRELLIFMLSPPNQAFGDSDCEAFPAECMVWRSEISVVRDKLTNKLKGELYILADTLLPDEDFNLNHHLANYGYSSMREVLKSQDDNELLFDKLSKHVVSKLNIFTQYPPDDLVALQKAFSVLDEDGQSQFRVLTEQLLFAAADMQAFSDAYKARFAKSEEGIKQQRGYQTREKERERVSKLLSKHASQDLATSGKKGKKHQVKRLGGDSASPGLQTIAVAASSSSSSSASTVASFSTTRANDVVSNRIFIIFGSDNALATEVDGNAQMHHPKTTLPLLSAVSSNENMVWAIASNAERAEDSLAYKSIDESVHKQHYKVGQPVYVRLDGRYNSDLDVILHAISSENPIFSKLKKNTGGNDGEFTNINATALNAYLSAEELDDGSRHVNASKPDVTLEVLDDGSRRVNTSKPDVTFTFASDATVNLKFGKIEVTFLLTKLRDNLLTLSHDNFHFFTLFKALDAARLSFHQDDIAHLEVLGIIAINDAPDDYEVISHRNVIFLDDKKKSLSVIKKAVPAVINVDTDDDNNVLNIKHFVSLYRDLKMKLDDEIQKNDFEKNLQESSERAACYAILKAINSIAYNGDGFKRPLIRIRKGEFVKDTESPRALEVEIPKIFKDVKDEIREVIAVNSDFHDLYEDTVEKLKKARAEHLGMWIASNNKKDPARILYQSILAITTGVDKNALSALLARWLSTDPGAATKLLKHDSRNNSQQPEAILLTVDDDSSDDSSDDDSTIDNQQDVFEEKDKEELVLTDEESVARDSENEAKEHTSKAEEKVSKSTTAKVRRSLLLDMKKSETPEEKDEVGDEDEFVLVNNYSERRLSSIDKSETGALDNIDHDASSDTPLKEASVSSTSSSTSAAASSSSSSSTVTDFAPLRDYTEISAAYRPVCLFGTPRPSNGQLVSRVTTESPVEQTRLKRAGSSPNLHAMNRAVSIFDINAVDEEKQRVQPYSFDI